MHAHASTSFGINCYESFCRCSSIFQQNNHLRNSHGKCLIHAYEYLHWANYSIHVKKSSISIFDQCYALKDSKPFYNVNGQFSGQGRQKQSGDGPQCYALKDSKPFYNVNGQYSGQGRQKQSGDGPAKLLESQAHKLLGGSGSMPPVKIFEN